VNAPGLDRPSGLVSLWDVMKQLNLVPFLLSTNKSGLASVMDAVEVFRFPKEKIDEDSMASNSRLYELVKKNCVALDLISSRATVDRILELLASSKSLRRSKLDKLQIELHGRLIDELIGREFYTLDSKEAEYYRNPRNGWEEIVALFPESITDIEETSKCFALSRYPAAVFHSLQVVEIGLIALGKEIGVVDPLSGWTAVTGRLQAIQKTKFPDRSAFERKHAEFLEQMVGTVEGLKNAWRNKVSHAHGRLALMTADFSPEIAEEILFATRAFMRRLATDGPLAEAPPPA
jgi:hypothetical protein